MGTSAHDLEWIGTADAASRFCVECGFAEWCSSLCACAQLMCRAVAVRAAKLFVLRDEWQWAAQFVASPVCSETTACGQRHVPPGTHRGARGPNSNTMARRRGGSQVCRARGGLQLCAVACGRVAHAHWWERFVCASVVPMHVYACWQVC